MFFKKKEKAVASEAIQEDGQRTEVPVGVDAQLSIKPVRKRRQRIKEEMDDTVSVCVEPVNKKCSMCESCMTKNNLNSCPIQLHLKDCDMKCMIPHKIQQSSLLVRDGEWIESGYPITSYPLVSDSIKTVKDSDDMRQVLRHKQMNWINNYYNIFRDQSISINVRHFELLAMIQNQYVTVVSSGDPKYKIGEERD